MVLAATAAALAAASAALLLYDSHVYHNTVIADVSTQAQVVGQASAAALIFDDPKAARETLAILRAKPGIVAGALYNAKGALFAAYRAPDVEADPLPKLPDPDAMRIEHGHVVLFKRIVENNEVLGTVYLKAQYKLAEHVINYLLIVGGVLVLGLLVALGIAAWLQRTISRPVLAISSVAHDVVERRDFSLRAPVTTDDEIGYLAGAFNDMLSEIERRADALERSNETLARAEEDLKKLNSELEQRVSERTTQLEAANKELEGFSYSVSHDLRAPVRAIGGFSKLLAEQHADQLDDEGQRKLGIVRSEAARMAALIDDLLAFSRLGRQSIQFRPVDMTELVQRNFDALKGQHHGAQPELRLGLLPEAVGDRSLLAQVWVNLISNAIKFSSKKEKPVIEVSAISDEREHTYFVRDNGAGFDPRFGAKLFGVFQRLHDPSEFPGTGVGLALVQRIVSRHGGRVWAEGQVGVGATFYFTLPRRSVDGAV
ncbi:MAG TPA: ATP-binding protein [Burkholderiales bacterium]|nr:ATP-binding protein [Burkholderiales bacterium]